MTTGIFGLALPYDTPSDGFLTRTGGDLREMICRGAITPAALNAECSFQLDHRRDKILCGTRLTLFNTRVGVYFCAHVPTSSPVLREALDARESWHGVSVAYDGTQAECVVDWPACTRQMTNITHFTEISLVVGDSRPGYASTWATTDRAEALARITKEIDSARSRVYGPSYKAFTEVLPRQGACYYAPETLTVRCSMYLGTSRGE